MDKEKTQIHLKKKTKRTIFYCLMVALPVLHFCVFYLGVNFNSILLSFKTITKEISPNGSLYYKETFTGLSTFKLVFEDLFAEHMKPVWKNTFLSFFLSILFSTPLGLLFSYYAFKKFFGSGVFKILLFLPQIVSGLVLMYCLQSSPVYPICSILPTPIRSIRFGSSVGGLALVAAS